MPPLSHTHARARTRIECVDVMGHNRVSMDEFEESCRTFHS